MVRTFVVFRLSFARCNFFLPLVPSWAILIVHLVLIGSSPCHSVPTLVSGWLCRSSLAPFGLVGVDALALVGQSLAWALAVETLKHVAHAPAG